MNVVDLQTYLRGLAGLLRGHKGEKPAVEFEAFCAGLEPFRELSIGALAEFLRKAEEYHRTGVLPAVEPKKQRAARPTAKAAKPKIKLATKNDAAAIAAAVETLQKLHDRFADPTLTEAVLDADLEKLAAGFDAEGWKAVARGFGLTSGLTSKVAIKKKMRDKIVERKDRFERSESFSTGTPAAPSPDAAAAAQP